MPSCSASPRSTSTTRKAVRASAGSLFHLPVCLEVPSLGTIAALRAAGVRVLAADGAGLADLDDEADSGRLEAPTAWVFGNEAWGLPESVRDSCDAVVRVPIHGRAESLNLATAAAVCLYASARAHRTGIPFGAGKVTREDGTGHRDRETRSQTVSYTKLDALEETGYVVLDRYDQAADPQEWLDITYVDWKSSGDTRFAPLASAYGDLECNGFWHHDPPKTDKDGVWVDENVAKAPILKARAEEPGSNIGRCRVIELKPNDYVETVTRNLHLDDNNRLNPEGTGWIVRGFFNLTDNPDSVMVLREDKDDPATESRIPLPAGAQVIVDTQRLYHAVWHPGG